MRSFEEWYDDPLGFEIDVLCGSYTFDELRQCYNAGATEARKSMRCSSCRYFASIVKDGFNRSHCESPNTTLTSIKEDPNKWGCCEHEERKENG